MPDLSSEPSLQQLRYQARDLQRAVRRGDQDALAEVAGRHPAGGPDGAAAAAFPLSAAQLVVARRYDFPSRARLRRYVEVVERYSRFPERMTVGGPENPADEFLRLACLYYEDDQPERWAQAHRVLLDHPEISHLSVAAAAAAADLPRLAAHLAADPGAASRPGGPFRCEPLFYLAYTRHDPAIGEAAVLGAARMLLQAGAGHGRPPAPSQEPARAGSRPRYPRSALRLHPARLGPVLRPGAARRAARAAHRPGGTLITPRPDD